MQTPDPRKSALIVIDLQKGITAANTAPHSAKDVVARTSVLADRFRKAGGLVVLVTVDFHTGFADAPDRPCDMPTTRSADGPPASFAELDPDLSAGANDLRITKRQWGAFYGTELDLQLRRRGIDTLVLTGIATNMGVESTARDAWERHYTLFFAEDAMTSFTTPMHEFAVTTIFPRLGFVQTCEQIAQSL